MKQVLDKDEIIDYILSLDENINVGQLEAYLEDYGMGQLRAELRVIPMEKLQMGPEDNHLSDNDKQQKYNKMKGECPPILIDENFNVLDGHHRIRAQKHQKKDEIKAYVLVVKEE